MSTAPPPFRRPRAEACDRLTAASLRPLLAPDAPACTLPGGQLAGLEWRPVVGCYGGRGRALLVRCPDCAAPSRVLWRPPGRGWGCWRCCPVSHPSHRRPGTHRRHRRPGGCAGKPQAWDRERLGQEIDRLALEFLGLQTRPLLPGMRPRWRNRLPLVWGLAELRCLSRRPDAPRLSWRRREAIEERLSALETLRILAVLEACPFRDRLLPPGDEQPRLLAAFSRATVFLTEWAVRRPAGDPRYRWPGADGPHRTAGAQEPRSPQIACSTGPDGPRHRDPHRTPVECLTGF